MTAGQRSGHSSECSSWCTTPAHGGGARRQAGCKHVKRRMGVYSEQARAQAGHPNNTETARQPRRSPCLHLPGTHCRRHAAPPASAAASAGRPCTRPSPSCAPLATVRQPRMGSQVSKNTKQQRHGRARRGSQEAWLGPGIHPVLALAKGCSPCVHIGSQLGGCPQTLAAAPAAGQVRPRARSPSTQTAAGAPLRTLHRAQRSASGRRPMNSGARCPCVAPPCKQAPPSPAARASAVR